jgi:general secretion pathway protein K
VRRRERGAVLILVLGVVSILSMLAVELAARSTARTQMASRVLRDSSFRRLFDSGSEIARGILSEPEAMTYDFWGDPWAQDVHFTLLPEEDATVRIADESGKINIARALSHSDEVPRLREMLDRLFDYLRQENPGGQGTQDKVLARLGIIPKTEKDPSRRPGPLFTLDGLREAGLEMSEVFGNSGLSRYLTCFGDGKINLNTAPPAVLYALGKDFDPAMVDRIVRFRGKGEDQRVAFTPFKEPRDLELVDGVVERLTVAGRPRVTRSLYAQVSDRVTTQSTCFSARISAGTVGGRRREAWVFFDIKRVARSGEPLHREVRKIVLEEILP